MTKSGFYVALDVNFYDHPKVVEAGELADRLYTAALCLAKRTWSDGYVSDAQLARTGLTDVDERAKKLEDVGLFDRDPERPGWMIHDWLDHGNRSKAEQDRIVEKRKTAGRKGGRARKQVGQADDTNVVKQVGKQVGQADGNQVGNQVGQPDLDLDLDLDLDRDLDHDLDHQPPRSATENGDADELAEVGGSTPREGPEHPAVKVLAPLGIVDAVPTRGEERVIARALGRGWTLDELIDLGHEAAADGNEPRKYLRGALGKRANTDPERLTAPRREEKLSYTQRKYGHLLDDDPGDTEPNHEGKP